MEARIVETDIMALELDPEFIPPLSLPVMDVVQMWQGGMWGWVGWILDNYLKKQHLVAAMALQSTWAIIEIAILVVGFLWSIHLCVLREYR